MDRGTRIAVIIIIARTELRLLNIDITIAEDVKVHLLGVLSCITVITAEWADTITSECVEALGDQASAHSEDRNTTDPDPAAITTITNNTEKLSPTSIVGHHTSESVTATITSENITKAAAVSLNAGIQST